MKNGIMKISKKEFYWLGGFSNPNLFRKHNGKNWDHFKILK
jgi:hypothetical protein